MVEFDVRSPTNITLRVHITDIRIMKHPSTPNNALARVPAETVMITGTVRNVFNKRKNRSRVI